MKIQIYENKKNKIHNIIINNWEGYGTIVADKNGKTLNLELIDKELFHLMQALNLYFTKKRKLKKMKIPPSKFYKVSGGISLEGD